MAIQQLSWLPALDMFNQYVTKYTEVLKQNRKKEAMQIISQKYSSLIDQTTDIEKLLGLMIQAQNEAMQMGVPEVTDYIMKYAQLKSPVLERQEQRQEASEMLGVFSNMDPNELYASPNGIVTRQQKIKEIESIPDYSKLEPQNKMKVLEFALGNDKLVRITGANYKDDDLFVTEYLTDKAGKTVQSINKKVRFDPLKGWVENDTGNAIDPITAEKLSNLLEQRKQHKENLRRGTGGPTEPTPYSPHTRYKYNPDGTIKRWNKDNIKYYKGKEKPESMIGQPVSYQIEMTKTGDYVYSDTKKPVDPVKELPFLLSPEQSVQMTIGSETTPTKEKPKTAEYLSKTIKIKSDRYKSTKGTPNIWNDLMLAEDDATQLRIANQKLPNMRFYGSVLSNPNNVNNIGNLHNADKYKVQDIQQNKDDGSIKLKYYSMGGWKEVTLEEYLALLDATYTDETGKTKIDTEKQDLLISLYNLRKIYK